MKPPNQNDIKIVIGNYHLIRTEAYNGRTTAQVTWVVAEKQGDTWRKERDFERKHEAQDWLSMCVSNPN